MLFLRVRVSLKIKNMQNSILIERQIVDKAIDALKTQFPMTIKWETAENKKNDKIQIDGFLTLQNKRIPAEVKGDFRMHQLGKILQQKSDYGDFILIANILSDTIKEKLKEEGISYLDTAGNAFIFYPPNIAIAVDGKKRIVNQEILKDKAFTKTGMGVVFKYLRSASLLELPYRSIAELANVSLDTISKTNESLKQQGFIRQLTKNQIGLTDKKRLFEKWADVYETRIKPTLLYEKFSFLNSDAERNWKELPLSDKTCWGGEAAANFQTNFIRPAIFTLYSTESKADLMRNYRLKPDPKGNIHVYLPFIDINLMWNGGSIIFNLPVGFEDNSKQDRLFTHPILTYADLLNSGDARNFEVAQKLYESHVKFFF
jgi:hypothetical protein